MLNPAQRTAAIFDTRTSGDIVTTNAEKIDPAFGWAGSTERGRQHYYRVQGPHFLVEYDASQNDGDHVHTVWRDFAGDFGRDLLRTHYAATAGSAHRH